MTVIVAATVLSVVVVPRVRPSAVPPLAEDPGRRRSGVLRHPGTWLGVVVALFLGNQLFVVAFVEQAWHGDPGRVTRYLPPGWFDLADIGSLAAVLPAWPWTVLHVQAALELPFVMLAYLLVGRWCGPDVAARVLAVRWLVSGAFTVTFCRIELDLANPWTPIDVVVRVASGIVTPLLLGGLTAGRARPSGLVPLALSAGALGCLVLAVYDVATLYNSAHLVRWLPVVTVAGVVLTLSRWWAHRDRRPVGPVMASATRSVGWFVALFAVPSLALRYGITFGARPVALVAGAVLVGQSLWLGWDRGRLRALVAVAAIASVAAAASFLAAGAVVTRGFPEGRLLAAAVAFVLAGGATGVLLDRRHRARTTADPRP